MLADDHTIFLEGLRSLLQAQPDLEVVGTSCNGREVLAGLRRTQPDVVITDISMPGLNGIEVVRRIASEHPDVKVICLSMHSEARFVEQALRAGASGYVLKDNAFEDLARAVRAVLANQIFICPQVAGVVVEAWRDERGGSPSSVHTLLSDREREVLQLLAEGHSTSEIAGRLNVSVKTVGTHRQNIMEKTGIDSVAGLTKYAITEGLTELAVRPRSSPPEP